MLYIISAKKSIKESDIVWLYHINLMSPSSMRPNLTFILQHVRQVTTQNPGLRQYETHQTGGQDSILHSDRDNSEFHCHSFMARGSRSIHAG